jgi:hypothetical protein
MKIYVVDGAGENDKRLWDGKYGNTVLVHGFVAPRLVAHGMASVFGLIAFHLAHLATINPFAVAAVSHTDNNTPNALMLFVYVALTEYGPSGGCPANTPHDKITGRWKGHLPIFPPTAYRSFSLTRMA